MATAYRTSQVTYVVAKLGLADLVEEGPRTTDELASVVGIERQQLGRLMRAATALGLFSIDDHGRFSSNELSQVLRSDVHASVRETVIFFGEHHYEAWGHLIERLRGDLADPTFYSTADSAATTSLHRASAEGTSQIALAVAALVEVNNGEFVLDVGGASGDLAAAVLRNQPSATGAVLDLPAAQSLYLQAPRHSDVDGRLSFLPGDFMKSVPVADVVLLKAVLHNWPDDVVTRLLARCATALTSHGRIYVIERCIPDQHSVGMDPRPYLSDLNMLATTGGRNRSVGEIFAALRACGLTRTSLVGQVNGLSVVEGRRSALATNHPGHLPQ